MIFKVLYQELQSEVPVRERTTSIYIEADSVRDVRNKLMDRDLDVEYIHPLDAAHLAYEEQSPDFKVENV